MSKKLNLKSIIYVLFFRFHSTIFSGVYLAFESGDSDARSTKIWLNTRFHTEQDICHLKTDGS